MPFTNIDAIPCTTDGAWFPLAEVAFACQDYSSIPSFYKIPAERTKPFGTVHAVLCAKDVVNEPFAVINADDFYSSQLFNDKTVTYGVEKLSTYMAKNISQGQNGYSFTVYKHGEKTCKINLNVLGKHNVYCALATFATSFASAYEQKFK